MPITRHFLGWDGPLTGKVCDFLLPRPHDGTVDLAADLILVPTRQAGRRLREALALRCAESGGAIVGARVMVPTGLLAPAAGAAPDAPDALLHAVWAEVLRGPEARAAGAVLGGGDREDYAWALQTGRMLQRLRQTLGDAGLGLQDAIGQLGDALPEPERWRAMAGLEAAFLERLRAIGYGDPCRRRIEAAGAPEVPPHVRRIVMAGLPEPSPLTLRALEALAARLDVAVLIHAPAEVAGGFDGWGRPDAAYWGALPIEIPDEEANLVVAGAPSDQVAAAMAQCPPPDAAGALRDVAIGAPDAALVPLLATALAERGIAAFDPAEPPLAAHPLGRVLAAASDLVCSGGYRAVAAFLRHPHVLDALQARERIAPATLLGELDAFQNARLPWRLDDLAGPLGGDAGASCPSLARAVRWTAALAGALGGGEPVEPALRRFLQQVYEHRTVRLGEPADVEFRAAAEAVDEVLHELSAPLQARCALDNTQALRLLLQRLGEATYARERAPAAIDLEGWLELPWNPARLLIVTGLNEGIVPDSRSQDAFLPDSIRGPLGMRDEPQRLARDAFLLRGLIESRRRDGRVVLLFGQTGAQGDPLMPSRLLFLCGDERLPHRARRLFGRVEEERPASPSSLAFRLDPSPRTREARAALDARRLSVTAFRDYLACPFRYYLARVLGLEAVADDKQGLDGADYGTLVHDVLHDMAVEGAWRERDADTLAAFLHQRLDHHLGERYGTRLGIPLLVAADSARQRLARLAAEQAALAAAGWEIVEAEIALDMKLGDFTVRGKIDRVDRNVRTGRLRILDYKTSDKAIDPEDAHLRGLGRREPDFAAVDVAGKPCRWLDLQLPLYRLLHAARAGRDEAPEVGYFNLPKAIGETGVRVWESLPPSLLESAHRCAGAVCERLAAREFWPPAGRVDFDPFEQLLMGDPAATVDAAAFAAGLKGVAP